MIRSLLDPITSWTSYHKKDKLKLDDEIADDTGKNTVLKFQDASENELQKRFKSAEFD